MDQLRKFKLIIGKFQLDEDKQSEKVQIIEKFPSSFRNNTPIKDPEINKQLKPGHYPVEQKARPKPLPLQQAVGKHWKFNNPDIWKK